MGLGDEATGPQMDEITTVFLARWPVPEQVRLPAPQHRLPTRFSMP